MDLRNCWLFFFKIRVTLLRFLLFILNFQKLLYPAISFESYQHNPLPKCPKISSYDFCVIPLRLYMYMYVMWIKICLLASLYCRLPLFHKWIFILNTQKMAYEISIKFIIHIALDEFSWLFLPTPCSLEKFLDFYFCMMKISNFNAWWTKKSCVNQKHFFGILLEN